MTVSSLQPPTFGISAQNFQLSYAGQTATSPVQNTPNGISAANQQGDSAAFPANNFDNIKSSGAAGNSGNNTPPTVPNSTKGATITQTVFDVLTGATTTIKITSEGNGQFTYSETDDSQNSASSYSSSGQPAAGQTTNAAGTIKQVVA